MRKTLCKALLATAVGIITIMILGCTWREPLLTGIYADVTQVTIISQNGEAFSVEKSPEVQAVFDALVDIRGKKKVLREDELQHDPVFTITIEYANGTADSLSITENLQSVYRYLNSDSSPKSCVIGDSTILVDTLSSLTTMSAKIIAEDGFVPDEKTAIAIAEAIWLPIYGDVIYSSTPFNATYMASGDYWYVCGTLPEDTLGGVPEIKIRKEDGEILYVSHGK